MTLEPALFAVFASLACLGAAGVAVAGSVARMAFSLVVSLSAVAGLFFLLHAPLVGATQLLVYVGGTVVLLIFGVMLTDAGPAARRKIGLFEALAAAAVGLALLAGLGWVGVGLADGVPARPAAAVAPDTLRPVGLRLLGFAGPSGGGYLLPFEIVSVHLLVVLVGAAYLARAKKRVGDRPAGGGS